MRRGGWATVGMMLGCAASLALFRPSVRGIYPLVVIAAGIVPGALIGGWWAVRAKRRAELAFRAELEELHFATTLDLASYERPGLLRGILLPTWVIATRNMTGRPWVEVQITGIAQQAFAELSVRAKTWAPADWPDFEIAEHPPAVERRLPAMRKERDGAFGPEFDERFKIRGGGIESLLPVLTERVQQKLLALPRKARITCEGGELRLERSLADPGDIRRLVTACDALGDPRRSPPPHADASASLETLT